MAKYTAQQCRHHAPLIRFCIYEVLPSGIHKQHDPHEYIHAHNAKAAVEAYQRANRGRQFVFKREQVQS